MGGRRFSASSSGRAGAAGSHSHRRLSRIAVLLCACALRWRPSESNLSFEEQVGDAGVCVAALFLLSLGCLRRLVTCLSWLCVGFLGWVTCPSPGSVQWQGKTGEGTDVSSPRGDRTRVLNQVKLPDSFLAVGKGGVWSLPPGTVLLQSIFLPAERTRTCLAFLAHGRRGRSVPGQCTRNTEGSAPPPPPPPLP